MTGRLRRRAPSRPFETRLALLLAPSVLMPWAVPTYAASRPTYWRVPAMARAFHEPPLLVMLRRLLLVKSSKPPPSNSAAPRFILGAVLYVCSSLVGVGVPGDCIGAGISGAGGGNAIGSLGTTRP